MIPHLTRGALFQFACFKQTLQPGKGLLSEFKLAVSIYLWIREEGLSTHKGSDI